MLSGSLAILLALLAAPELTRGLSLYRQQQFAAAEREFRTALAKDPKEAGTRLYLARTLIALDRVPEALREIESATARSTTPDIQFQAGRILRELAESRFHRLQAIAPNSAAVRELSGARFERTGNLAEALKEYRAAVSLDPKRPGAHYRVGNILWRMRDLDAAASELKKELSLSPHHALANLRLGQLLLAQNQDAEALPYLEKSAAAMPASIEARRELGKAYHKNQRSADARREWEAVAKARPEDDQVHYLLGNLYRELGEDALAKGELQKHRAILERRRARSEQR